MEKRTSRRTSRERLNDMVSVLRGQIVTGYLPVGGYLPSEKVLAVEFGLSNQTVRKGLDTLTAEGLIEKIPRVGTRVIGQGEESRATVRLGFHTSVTREADIERLLQLFSATCPNVSVQAIPLSNYNFDYIRQYLAAGILDAVMLNYTDFQALRENGCEALLEPMERKPDIYPFLADGFTADGQLLVQPFIFSPLILCYNRDHFQDAGLPEPDSSWRWDDLIEASRQLSVPNDRLGFHCDFYSLNRWPLLPLQAGVRFERGADGGIRLAGTRMLESLRYCRSLKNDIPFLSEGDTTGKSEQLFAMGKVSVIMTSYFYLNYFFGENVPFDLSPVPHLGSPATLLLNIGLAVNRQSQVKESAMKVVEFLTSYEAQLYIRRQTYSLPALKAAAEWSGVETSYRPPRFSLFRETIPGFRYFTELGIAADELASLNREVKMYWAGLEAEDAFCERIDNKWAVGS